MGHSKRPINPVTTDRWLLQADVFFCGRTLRFFRLVTGILLSLLLSCVLYSCSDTDDKNRILHIIASAAEQAEQHNISGVLAHTVDTFKAQPGDHDRRSARGILWWAFRHYGKLTVLYPQPAISVDENSEAAAAEIYFLIVKKEGSIPDLKELAKDPQKWLQAVGENADLYQLQLELIQLDSQWKVNAARLAPYAASGF